MVRQGTDRIDDWWNRRVPLQDSTRRALVRKSQKESSKDEALKKASALRPDLSVSAPGAQPKTCALTKPTSL
jgi:hypothetical protein